MSERGVFYELGKAAARVESAGVERPRPSGAGRPVVGVVLAAALGAAYLAGVVSLAVFGAALFLVLLVATLVSSVELVQAYERRALTVFGANRGLLEPGLHFVPPFVSRTYRFDVRTAALDVPTQEAITRDNSPVRADAVLYIRVVDAEKAFLGVDDYRRATLYLAQTSLRAVLGDMALDETLSRREVINARIREQLDEPTDAWGVRVEAVEVREVKPSAGVVDAMEQQSAAERRRRAMILEAQGERVSAVERAEGEKRANIIRAQGEKRSRVLEAQGDAVSTVLRARAAESMGERAILEKGMETLASIGRSPSTTLVLPQELTSLLGRYGRHLSGSDAREAVPPLEPGAFDAETRRLLGLDTFAADFDVAEVTDAGVPIEIESSEEPEEPEEALER
ncbi:SPFH domain-containing protein [Halomarina ordinaria]|uniref:SPFH domain-containing protein n=1 Tax=Halomarina ordinaria TaxID=3033939 RepID=A0ABD5UAS9_9EURY|nr:SPFH domain-containing protein [Halomarina sp. PSRA2]